MAELISSIGSGKDYSTVEAWEGAEAGSVASGDQVVAEIYGDVTGSAGINGFECADATAKVIIRNSPSGKHDGTPSTGDRLTTGVSPFVLNLVGIPVFTTTYIVEGLVIDAGVDTGVDFNDAGEHLITNVNDCIFIGTGGAGWATQTNGASNASTLISINNSVSIGPSRGFYGLSGQTAKTRFNYCTSALGSLFGFVFGIATNCWTSEVGNTDYIAMNAASDFNISDDGSATGSNVLINKNVPGDYFTDHANDDYSLKDTTDDGGVFGVTGLAGTPISGITTDIVGTARDGTTPDIGAFEFAAGTQPPVTTNTTVVPDTQEQGQDVELSADINDADHTIDQAEYYIDSDPGEGSGVAMSLGAGTTSREASATIETPGLSIASHTVHVRGHDSTDGWGSTDSTNLEIEAIPVPYEPSLVLSDPQIVGSWRIDQMTLDKVNANLPLREDRGIQDVKVPGAVFSTSTYPNLDPDIIGEPIPNAIGVGLRGLPAFLIDASTNTFKVVNNPLLSWDGFRDEDNKKFVPDVVDLATGEFTYAAWDGDTELFADISCSGENPIDAKKLLLTDLLRGANLPDSRLDTTSTGKGFGANGARVKHIRGTSSRTGAEKVDFSISLYMDEPKKVEEWIQEVDAASFGITYVDQAGVWQCKAWEPIPSDDMLHLDELFLKDPKFTWKMSDPVTRVVANYAKDFGRDSVQSAIHANDELRQLRGLSQHATLTREVPISDLFGATYWAQRTMAMRGVPRRILTCTATQEFSLLELGDFPRVTYAPLKIDGPYEVIKVMQQADSMEVNLTLIDVRGFGDTVGFYMSDVAPDWDNSRNDAEIKNDRENGAWYTDDAGYADTDDPKRSFEEAVYI